MLKLYENIRALRRHNKWTQEELAARMGYTDRSTIAKIENGKVDLPQTKIVEFAKVFNVSPGELMGWGDADYLVNSPDLVPLSDEARELWKQYEGLSPEKQAAFLNYLKFLQSDT
jgi:transcriptional regulator with XRE-family HTH domain